MSEEIQEILNKLSNRKQETLLQGLRECQLKNIEHPFITKEEYIDKTLDYINNLQQENQRLKEVIEKANNELITLIQIIMEQPSKNVEEDNYLLSRLESISNILVGGNND